MFIPYNKIEDDSRCWIYQVDKKITSLEKKFIEKKIRYFCENWTSHNVPVKSSFIIDLDYYILLFADEQHTNISGCAIDEQRKIIEKISEELKIKISTYNRIGVFINNKLIFLSKKEIIDRINKYEMSSNSEIINITIKNKKEYQKKWIRTIKESWMKNILTKKTPLSE